METYKQDIKRHKIENAIVEQQKRMKRFNRLLHEMNQSGGKNSSLNNLVEYNQINTSNNKSIILDNINKHIHYLENNIQNLHKNGYKCKEAKHEKNRLVTLKKNLSKN